MGFAWVRGAITRVKLARSVVISDCAETGLQLRYYRESNQTRIMTVSEANK